MTARPSTSLRLGDCTIDLSTRVIVIGILGAASRPVDALVADAATLVADGADALQLDALDALDTVHEPATVTATVTALCARAGAPVGVTTSRADVFDAVCAAGAVFGDDPTGFTDPDYLATAAKHHATVVVTGASVALAQRAEAAGLGAEQVILDVGDGRARPGAAAGSYPRLLSDIATGDDGLAAIAYNIIHGCRVVRVHDVKGAARVCRVTEALLRGKA
jgi:dihydropteroate synthase